MEETLESTTEMTQPVIVDLGAQKPGNLKDLKKGQGKLWDEVLNVIEEVKDMLGEGADGKVIVPVVMIYRKKMKRRRIDRVFRPYMKVLR